MNIETKALSEARKRYGIHTLLDKIHENENFILYNSYQPEYKTTGDDKFINHRGHEMTLADKKKGQIYFHNFFSPEGDLLNYFTLEELEPNKNWSLENWHEELKRWGVVEKQLVFHILSLAGYDGSISPSPYPFSMSGYYKIAKEHFGTFDFENERETGRTSYSYITSFLEVLQKLNISYEEDDSFIIVQKVVGSLPDPPGKLAPR
ncbi:MAG: hypothetical protein JSS76_15225 [Bacteroidetes bacterium]|nr:hypothetical protein [Bacteroidota bacterium]MBS1686095.1 hypothetical protein [Bacteroidota bacterium]